MRRAEVRLARDHVTVASATYSHGGGFGLTKYASTESKMERLMDQLLEGF